MKNQNQVLPTARSIKHRLNKEHLEKVLEAKKFRSFEDDIISIDAQFKRQLTFGTSTVTPCS